MRRLGWLLPLALLAATPALADGKGDFAAGYQASRVGNDRQAARDYGHAAEAPDLSQAVRAAAYFNQGNALSRLGQHEDAVRAYDKALALTDKKAAIYLNRGIARHRLGRTKEAIADLDQAIALDPEDPRAYNSRANAYLDVFRYDEALDDYAKALSLNPDYAVAERNQEVAAKARDEYRAAIAKYDSGVERQPDSALAYIERGVARFNLGDFGGAAADFETAARKEPANAYGALWLYVALARGGGDASARVKELAGGLDRGKWPAPVVDVVLGAKSVDEMEALTADPDAETQREKQCVLYFFAAEHLLAEGKPKPAAEMFRRTLATKIEEFLQYHAAEVELQRLAL